MPPSRRPKGWTVPVPNIGNTFKLRVICLRGLSIFRSTEVEKQESTLFSFNMYDCVESSKFYDQIKLVHNSILSKMKVCDCV